MNSDTVTTGKGDEFRYTIWDTPLQRTIEEMKEDVAAIDQLLYEATALHAAIRSIDAQIIAILSLGCPF